MANERDFSMTPLANPEADTTYAASGIRNASPASDASLRTDEHAAPIATPDRELRLRIRDILPAHVFEREPWRVLFAPLLVAVIVALSAVLALAHPAWWFGLPSSFALGSLYAGFFFFAHEVAHGATVRSRRLQDAVLYAAGTIFMVSPHLWRVWHNHVHHPLAQCAGHDPDNFGSVQQYLTDGWLKRLILKVAPGSRHWLSIFYLPTFFTIHAQGVLWYKSRHSSQFARLRRARAGIDSACMLTFWAMLWWWVGSRVALYVIVLPMLAANTVMLCYILTNHLLRAMSAGEVCTDTLAVTMSVRTLDILDRLHFHFSHHVEHHLFPSMSSRHYPLVRRALRQVATDRYLAPSHAWALKILFVTPRLYDGTDVLVDPDTQRRVKVSKVKEILDAL